MPIRVGNGLNAVTSGLQVNATVQPRPWIRVTGSYSLLSHDLSLDPDSRDLGRGLLETIDPKHQAQLLVRLDLPRRIELDTSTRHVSALPNPGTPAYTEAGFRVGWPATSWLESCADWPRPPARRSSRVRLAHLVPPDPPAARGVHPSDDHVLMRALLLVGSLLVAGAGAAPSAAQTDTLEYDVKAVFLLNFTRYVDWPDAPAPAPFRLCVLEPNPFGPRLDAVVAGETWRDQAIVLAVVHESSETAGCHLLYVPAAATERFVAIQRSVAARPILTVGETRRFFSAGGMIHLFLQDSRVRFSINQRAAVTAGLTISSRLLRLAREIVSPEQREMTASRPTRSLRRKLTLVTLVTIVTAQLFAAVALIAWERVRARGSLVDDLQMQSRIVVDNSAAALSFADHDAALETLRSLRDSEGFEQACLYDEHGQLFAAETASGDCPPSAGGDGATFGSGVVVSSPVTAPGRGRIGTLSLRSSMKPVNDRLRDQIVGTLVVLLASALTAVVLMARLQRILTLPLQHLAETAQAVSRDRDYSRRVRKEDDDEVGAVAESVNDMLEQIQARDEELQNALRLKDEFLATVSHELRTPLNAMLGWSHVLRNQQRTPAITEQAADAIDRNARIQARLIEDILDVSRIITGKMRIEPVDTDLVLIIQSAVEVVLPSAQAKTITIETTLPQSAPFVGDPDRLRQVLWNLLSNAVKFTPQDGRGAGDTRAGDQRVSHRCRRQRPRHDHGLPALRLPAVPSGRRVVHAQPGRPGARTRDCAPPDGVERRIDSGDQPRPQPGFHLHHAPATDGTGDRFSGQQRRGGRRVRSGGFLEFGDEGLQRRDVRVVGLREALHVVLLGHLLFAPVAVEPDALAAGVLHVERLVGLAARPQAVGAAVGDHHAALGNRGAVQVDVDVAELVPDQLFVDHRGRRGACGNDEQLSRKEQRGDELIGGGRVPGGDAIELSLREQIGELFDEGARSATPAPRPAWPSGMRR